MKMRLKVMFILVLLAIFSVLLFSRGSESWTNYPVAIYPSLVADDWTLLVGSKSHHTNEQVNMSTMLQITKTNAQDGMQPLSANLTSWAGIAPGAKEDQSANLDSWSLLATSSKQDASANLDSWSLLATSTKQNHSTGLDYWDGVTADNTTITISGGQLHAPGGGSGNMTASGSFTVGHIIIANNTSGTAAIDGGHAPGDYQLSLGFTPFTPLQVTNAILGLTIPLDSLAGSDTNFFLVGSSTNTVQGQIGTGLKWTKLGPGTNRLDVTVAGGGSGALAITNILVTNNIPLVMDLAVVQSGTLQLLTNATLVFTNTYALTNYHDQSAYFNVWQDTNGTRRLTSITVAGGILRTNNSNMQGTNASEMDTLLVRYGPTGTNLLANWTTNWLPTLSYTNSLNTAGGGGGGWVLQSAQFVKSANTSDVITAATNTSGATLYVLVVGSAGATSAPTNTSQSTWNNIITQSDASGGNVTIWTATNGLGNAAEVVGLAGSFIYPSMSLYTFTGGAGGVVDKTSGATGSSSTATGQPGTITPLANGELIVSGFTSHNISATLTVDSGLSTPIFGGQNSAASFSGSAYFVQGTAGAINPLWTKDAADFLATVQISIK